MKNQLVIGLDFGTLSARAVLASAQNGEIVAEASCTYSHGVITKKLESGRQLPESYALAEAGDYREALCTCVRQVISGQNVQQIAGIGISATTYSMVPCTQTGEALSEREEFRSEPMAYVKLWKHHGAVRQAERIMDCYRNRKMFRVIGRYGGAANCEWALPKLLETYEEAPEVFQCTWRFCDLGEWIAWILTGHPVNSIYSLGFKGMWAPDLGFPSREELEELCPGFSQGYFDKFAGTPANYEKACGYLSRQAAEWLGLPEGIPVATPLGDGSCPGVYFCGIDPGALAITLGTSMAMAFVSSELLPINGINGVVKDGILPGTYSYDAGQPCAGDMLDWFVHQQTPAEYFAAAENAGLSIFEYLNQLAVERTPWEISLTVLDWFNGNRSVLNNQALRGVIAGYSLQTRPETVYCAMIQGLACSTRKIIEVLAENGICFDRIIVCGGIAEKNRFILEQYADILDTPVYMSGQRQITALSAAILAVAAAGATVKEAAEYMAKREFDVILPDSVHKKEYGKIYKRWESLYRLLADYYTNMEDQR